VPCPNLPPTYFPNPPALPGGVSLAAFTPPTITLGLCCNIQVPPWGSFPIPLPPFPIGTLAAVAAMLVGIVPGIAATLDAIPIPCPVE
jgi:hypothetical protein